jgi:hypothetical protein
MLKCEAAYVTDISSHDNESYITIIFVGYIRIILSQLDEYKTLYLQSSGTIPSKRGGS